MPRRHTKSVNTNLTQEQIEALKSVYQGNVAELMRAMLKTYVEQQGGTWPQPAKREKRK
jgi:hypothetical protein